MQEKVMPSPKRSEKKPLEIGHSDHEFMQAHDKSYIIPKAIDKGLESLGDRFMYNKEFATHCGISETALSQHRSQYDEHVVLVEDKKVVWWGTKKKAEYWRAKLKGLVPK